MVAGKKLIIIALAGAVLSIGGFFLYLNLAFPKVRCDAAKHLDAPEDLTDCYTCHAKVTPKLAQDWFDSKHGVTLVKCAICHGDPSGKGSLPFTIAPSPKDICMKCHDPAMKRMEEKFGGIYENCNSCHPNHQNPMHRNAYERPGESKTSF